MAVDIDGATSLYLNQALRESLGGYGRVFTEWAPPVSLPYVVVVQGDEDLSYTSVDASGSDYSIGIGSIQVSILAARKSQASQIGLAVVRYLKDADLVFDSGILKEMRVSSQHWVPETLEGFDIGGDTVFHRVLIFRYAVQRNSV